MCLLGTNVVDLLLLLVACFLFFVVFSSSSSFFFCCLSGCGVGMSFSEGRFLASMSRALSACSGLLSASVSPLSSSPHLYADKFAVAALLCAQTAAALARVLAALGLAHPDLLAQVPPKTKKKKKERERKKRRKREGKSSKLHDWSFLHHARRTGPSVSHQHAFCGKR